jgi:zinc/manganese transport system substrate-binding protein
VYGSLRHSLRLDARLGLIAAAMLFVTAACSSAASPSPSATAATLAPGASAAPTPPVGGSPIAVLGTENFYADVLTEVGGSRVSATSLLNDPNTDPHSFEASPQAAATVADAQLVIVNGLGYDDFMQHLLDASPKSGRVVINVQQLLGLSNDVNAHIWYDPGTMPKVATAVEAALAKMEPGNADYYSAQLTAYLASLKPLTDKIAEMKAKYSGAPVAFTEPVAGYLANAIGLNVLTPEGFQKAIEDGTDPAPGDVATERDLLTEHKVRALLFNSQVITPLTTQIHDLAVSNGIPVVGVAETLPPNYGTYEAWQLAQMDQLEQALAMGA